MKYFIGYFDYLGYKQFLLNNSEDHLKTRAYQILRDIETALSQGVHKEVYTGAAVADFEKVTVNCLNISDTIIFWTHDDSIKSCLELLNICYIFNFQQNLSNFPIRGYLIYDTFEFITGNTVNKRGAVYSPNLMYGKGLLHAHETSGLLNWAGTAIDKSLIEKAGNNHDIETFLKNKAKLYQVPYKTKNPDREYTIEQYALNLSANPLNEIAHSNLKTSITKVFEKDNKSMTAAVKIKLKIR